MTLLSALWVLQFMGALCAALTTRKAGAAFMGYVMTGHFVPCVGWEL